MPFLPQTLISWLSQITWMLNILWCHFFPKHPSHNPSSCCETTSPPLTLNPLTSPTHSKHKTIRDGPVPSEMQFVGSAPHQMWSLNQLPGLGNPLHPSWHLRVPKESCRNVTCSKSPPHLHLIAEMIPAGSKPVRNFLIWNLAIPHLHTNSFCATFSTLI